MNEFIQVLTLLAENGLSELVFAFAALIGAGAYAWRSRTRGVAALTQILLDRVTSLEKSNADKDLRITALENENRRILHALESVSLEYDEYRSAVSSGHTPPRREPTNPRFQIAREVP